MLSVVQAVSAGIENGPCGCAGFLQQFAAVIDDEKPHLHLGKALAELSGGRQPNRVICTGHSLGGALATLGAHFSPSHAMHLCAWKDSSSDCHVFNKHVSASGHVHAMC